MGFIKEIKFTHFRNYTNWHCHFNEPIIGFCGKNGTGKTNILDAIYSICCCKSYFNRLDSSNTTYDLVGHRIDVFFENTLQATDKVSLIFRENNKKEICLNSIAYEKFSHHLGKFPCVMVAPDDTELINGGSEIRRKFIDAILVQTNSNYLKNLIDYNKILQQKNALLKQWQNQPNINFDLIETLNHLLAPLGSYIYNCRSVFLEELIPAVNLLYNEIANNSEKIELKYKSQLLADNFESLLNNGLSQEVSMQRCTLGIHKDDVDILMDSTKFKQVASQGQKKSLLFALKLAEWKYMQKQTGISPTLLLDDIFEKLDNARLVALLAIILKQPNIQIFITHTESRKLKEVFQSLKHDIQIVQIDNK